LPIVEFAYFQTAAGPVTAAPLLTGRPAPHPVALPPNPQLAEACLSSDPRKPSELQPASSFPLAGALADLAN
jgi:hypothetical protein